jgi:hypothetical protein
MVLIRSRDNRCVFYGVPGDTRSPLPKPASVNDPMVRLAADATHDCQKRGWLDSEYTLTPAGRKALESSHVE